MLTLQKEFAQFVDAIKVAARDGKPLEDLKTRSLHTQREDEVPYKPYFDCGKAARDLQWQGAYTAGETIIEQCLALRRANLWTS